MKTFNNEKEALKNCKDDHIAVENPTVYAIRHPSGKFLCVGLFADPEAKCDNTENRYVLEMDSNKALMEEQLKILIDFYENPPPDCSYLEFDFDAAKENVEWLKECEVVRLV